MYSLSRPSSWMIYALVSVVLVYYLIRETPGDTLSEDASAPGARYLPTTPRVWISMGICWGQNAQVHGKKEFPYKEAALRSVSLWSKLTEAQPIIQISYTESISAELLDYKKGLEVNGAFVYVNKTNDLPCVLSSQLTRMLAYKLDIVSPNDIIITADVDAFVGTPHILDPLNQTKAVWIWQYELTEQGGDTFAMSFIAATSLIWRDILGDPGDLNQLSNLYDFRKSENAQSWGIDQLIVSRELLDSGLCSLPSNNILWQTVGLSPNSQRRNEEDCWKGTRIFDNCNKGKLLSFCYWWHFYPNDGIQALDNKYREIMKEFGISEELNL